MTDSGVVSQDVAVLPDGEPAAETAQSQVQSHSQEDQAITLPRLKKIIKDVKKAQMWSWHILHPEAVANGRVNNTRSMFLSNRGLYSNKSTDVAEISASLCVVELMHNRIPLCDTTCLQLHLVLSRWPKGSALLHNARETLVETSTGKLIAESGRVEVMAMRCGVPVPSIISSLPFAACVIEVPRLYTTSLHNLVAQLLLSGVPVFIAGESADVKAAVAALKATVTEDMYQCDVAIYNLSSKTPLYTSSSHLVVLPPLIRGCLVTWLILKGPCPLCCLLRYFRTF